MARKDSVQKYIRKPKKRRPGIHSKNNSKKKIMVGQGKRR